MEKVVSSNRASRTHPWPAGPLQVDLAAGEAHVWAATLDDVAPEARLRLFETLDAGERGRAARFAFEALRLRYVVAHGFLRDVLSRYCGVEPARLAFAAGPQGKPFLQHPPGGVHFNLSHSTAMAICAVARTEIGADIEAARGFRDRTSLEAACFGPKEREWLAETAAAEVDTAETGDAFFACWTRKEAVLKADGAGLSLGLHSFEVLPDADGAFVALAAGRRYRVVDLPPPPGYAAAIAAGAPLDIRCWTWTPDAGTRAIAE
jgi:4'-phosphopantetheinyl transferase